MLINLKKLRENAGISQKQLGEAVCVSQQSINKYENHNIEPDIKTLVKLADYFKTSVDYIVGHTDIIHRIEVVEPFDLNSEEAQLIRQFRVLTDKQKESINYVIENYLHL